MPTPWIQALKLWNDQKGGKWQIPRKGSPEHEAVAKIMRGFVGTKKDMEKRGPGRPRKGEMRRLKEEPMQEFVETPASYMDMETVAEELRAKKESKPEEVSVPKPPMPEAPVKRGRGRPKGALGKKKREAKSPVIVPLDAPLPPLPTNPIEAAVVDKTAVVEEPKVVAAKKAPRKRLPKAPKAPKAPAMKIEEVMAEEPERVVRKRRPSVHVPPKALVDLAEKLVADAIRHASQEIAQQTAEKTVEAVKKAKRAAKPKISSEAKAFVLKAPNVPTLKSKREFNEVFRKPLQALFSIAEDYAAGKLSKDDVSIGKVVGEEVMEKREEIKNLQIERISRDEKTGEFLVSINVYLYGDGYTNGRYDITLAYNPDDEKRPVYVESFMMKHPQTAAPSVEKQKQVRELVEKYGKKLAEDEA